MLRSAVIYGRSAFTHSSWTSVHAHLEGKDDDLVTVAPMLNRVTNWPHYLLDSEADHKLDSIRQHGRTGRPLGSDEFIDDLERLTGIELRRGKPGPRTGR